MDWFQGKFTGKPHDLHGKIDGFRLRCSPTNQSIDLYPIIKISKIDAPMMVACWTGITLELHPCVQFIMHHLRLSQLRYSMIFLIDACSYIHMYVCIIFFFHWQCMCSNKSKEVIHSLTCLVYIPLNLPTWTSRRSCAWCARRSQRTPRRCIRSLYLPTPGVRWGP